MWCVVHVRVHALRTTRTAGKFLPSCSNGLPRGTDCQSVIRVISIAYFWWLAEFVVEVSLHDECPMTGFMVWTAGEECANNMMRSRTHL